MILGGRKKLSKKVNGAIDRARRELSGTITGTNGASS